MQSLKDVLMKRDGLTENEAMEEIEGAREELAYLLECGDMIGADTFMEDYFGLEPDYLIELL
jgi:hypothetical protein